MFIITNATLVGGRRFKPHARHSSQRSDNELNEFMNTPAPKPALKATRHYDPPIKELMATKPSYSYSNVDHTHQLFQPRQGF